MTRRFAVGQVVYVISAEHNKVLPFQVVEEITRKTIRGDEVHYKVVYGTDQTKMKLLSEIKGELFTSLDEARAHLMKNVTAWVDGQITAARKAAVEWYKTPDSVDLPPMELPLAPPPADLHPSISGDPHIPDDGEANLVELPDGRVVKARVKQVSK